MDNALRMVGIAKKAGRLEVGEEPVGAAARAHQAKLILVASDTADNSARRAAHFAEQGNVPWIRVPFTKTELGRVLGRSSCAMVAMMEVGMASSLMAGLARQQPEIYGETACQLSEKSAKALKRQKEKRAHEKNLQRGKKKPWAAPPARENRPAKGKKKPAAVAKPKGTEAGPARKRPVPHGIVSIRTGKPAGTEK